MLEKQRANPENTRRRKQRKNKKKRRKTKQQINYKEREQRKERRESLVVNPQTRDQSKRITLKEASI